MGEKYWDMDRVQKQSRFEQKLSLLIAVCLSIGSGIDEEVSSFVSDDEFRKRVSAEDWELIENTKDEVLDLYFDMV